MIYSVVCFFSLMLSCFASVPPAASKPKGILDIKDIFSKPIILMAIVVAAAIAVTAAFYFISARLQPQDEDNDVLVVEKELDQSSISFKMKVIGGVSVAVLAIAFALHISIEAGLFDDKSPRQFVIYETGDHGKQEITEYYGTPDGAKKLSHGTVLFACVDSRNTIHLFLGPDRKTKPNVAKAVRHAKSCREAGFSTTIIDLRKRAIDLTLKWAYKDPKFKQLVDNAIKKQQAIPKDVDIMEAFYWALEKDPYAYLWHVNNDWFSDYLIKTFSYPVADRDEENKAGLFFNWVIREGERRQAAKARGTA